MRILITGHSLIHERQQYMAEELAKLGNEVLVVAPERWNELIANPVKKENYELKSLEPTTNVIATYLLRGLERVVKEFRPDFVYCFEEPGTPFAFQVSDVCMDWPSEKQYIDYGFFTWENRPFDGGLIAGTEALKYSKFVICGNSGAKDRMDCIGMGEKSHVILGVGINMDLFKPSDAKKEYDIVYSGRFAPEKGVEYIDNIALRNDLSVLWLGRGPYQPKSGTIVSWCPYNEVPAYLNMAKIAVQFPYATDHWIEQHNSSVLEAMACGLPLTTSFSGALTEVVRGCVDVMMSPEKSEYGLKICILDLLEAYDKFPTRWEVMTTRGRAFVEKNYSTQVIARKLDKIFKEV